MSKPNGPIAHFVLFPDTGTVHAYASRAAALASCPLGLEGKPVHVTPKGANANKDKTAGFILEFMRAKPARPPSVPAVTICRRFHTSLLRTNIQKATRRCKPEVAVRTVFQYYAQLDGFNKANENRRKICERQFMIAGEDCSGGALLGLLPCFVLDMVAKHKGWTHLPSDAVLVARSAAGLAASKERGADILALQLASGSNRTPPPAAKLSELAAEVFSMEGLEPEKAALAIAFACKAQYASSKHVEQALVHNTVARVILSQVRDHESSKSKAWFSHHEQARSAATALVSRLCTTGKVATGIIREADCLYYSVDHHTSNIRKRLEQEIRRRFAGADRVSEADKTKLYKFEAYFNVRDQAERKHVHSLWKKTGLAELIKFRADPSTGLHCSWGISKELSNADTARFMAAWPDAAETCWIEIQPKEKKVGGRKNNQEKKRKGGPTPGAPGAGQRSIADMFGTIGARKPKQRKK